MNMETRVRINCTLENRTGTAILVMPDGEGLEKCWVPLAQVFEIHPEDGYIVMSWWLAQTRGWV